MINFNKDELVLREVRKHWLVLVLELIGLFFAALAPLVLFATLKSFGLIFEFSSTNHSGGNLTFVLFIYSAWLLILWLISFMIWTDYYLDVWIITDKKIFHVEQRGLFNRDVAVLHLDRIQDISFEIHGFINTLMDIGDVYIQTAAQEKKFIIRGVPSPIKVHDDLNEALVNFRNNFNY